MAKLLFKNPIFLMQKRLAASISTSPAVASASRRYNSVVDLLRSHGFDHTHLAAMMDKGPKILTDLKVDENLKPKLEYLAQNGFSGSHLHKLIVSNPGILRRSLSSGIKLALELLKSLLGMEERVLLAVKRSSRLLSNDLESTLLRPNIDLLVKEGVSLEAITKSFLIDPNSMQSSVHRLVSALEIVKGPLGIDPAAPKFLLAVMKIASSSVVPWEKKVQLFKSFGFSQEQVRSIFARHPECLSRSEETLKTKLEFYLGTVKLKLDDIISYPLLLSLAIDTRARPRHNVIKLLLSEKLLKDDAKLALARNLTISEDKFMKRYVMPHLEQVPSLLEMYSNNKVSQQTSI